MQTNNIFNKKNSFLESRKLESKIILEKALNSIDDEELKFINFMSSDMCKEYSLIENYYIKSTHGNYTFLEKEFTNKEYKTHNNSKNTKIRNLIFETTNELFNDEELREIIKYKNSTNPGIQLYIKYDKNDKNAYVYLIDLYHMAITTDYRLKGKKIKDNPVEHYNRMKEKVASKCNLNKMIK